MIGKKSEQHKGEKYIVLFKKGQTLREIAEQFGVSHQNVSHSLRKYYPGFQKFSGWRRKIIKKICPICHTKFERLEDKIGKTCSIACGQKTRMYFDVPIKKLPIEKFRKYQRDRARRYRKTQKGKEITARIQKEQTKKFRNKENARGILNSAVKRGKIKKPKECSMCGKSKLRIVGHHSDYTKPLKVIWLCDVCHKKIHRQK